MSKFFLGFLRRETVGVFNEIYYDFCGAKSHFYLIDEEIMKISG